MSFIQQISKGIGQNCLIPVSRALDQNGKVRSETAGTYNHLVDYLAGRSSTICKRDICQKRNGKMWEFFPSRGPPSPGFGNFFPILPFIFGRSPMLKTVKNGSGIRVAPPPLFFQNSHIFPFFFWQRP